MKLAKTQKLCPCCEKIFIKPPHLSYKAWNKRIWCSVKCGALKLPIKIRKQKNTKQCLCCFKLFTKGITESNPNFENRDYCSCKCSHIKLPLKEYLQQKFEYILSNTIKTKSGCLEYQGTKTTENYGQISIFNKPKFVHRFVWEQIRGEIPENLNVLHSCDNTICCNIEHLFLGTNQDNMKDRDQKGRQAKEFRLPFTKLSDQNKIELIQMAKEGVPYSKIGRKFNISKARACKIARENGIYRK